MLASAPHESRHVNLPQDDGSDSDLDLLDQEHGDISARPVAASYDDPSQQKPPVRARGSVLPGAVSESAESSSNGAPANGDADAVEKEGVYVDWNVETQGRRVGYENLTAIDWIFEYTKERQRLRRLLATSSGWSGTLRQLLDNSHVWIVLVVTGLMVGLVAAFINIASDWLGDIKTGYCKDTATSTQFYLSKQFCCWGHDEVSQCREWTPWRKALKIENLGGAYVVEYIFFVLYATLFAACSAVLVQGYSRYAKQSGIPEIKTMLGGYVIKEFLGGWTLITKSIGVCLSVASGLWLGKEGPLVHLACCCANIAMRPFDSLSSNEARKREVLSAAAASGISVAFGAPVGGVLFSLEQLSYYFPDKIMWQSFVCAMIAAVTLQALNPFHTGKIVLYQVRYTTGWHGFELVPFVLLGITGGLFGGLFIKLNIFVARLRRSENYPLRNRPILEVSIVAAIAAMINFPNLFMRAQLSELVYYLFAECATIGNNDIFGLCKATVAGSLSMVSLLVTAAGLGTLLAAVTFGLPIPAGIILPSLAIGALYGRALGVIVELLHKHHANSMVFAACEPDVPCITPGTYAIVGAASALAGTTRMTASIVVIMFELTGALTYVLPIMIAVMLAKWVGDAFGPRSIYDAWIQLNEYPYIDNRDDVAAPAIPAASIMTRTGDMTCINADRSYSLEDLRNLLRTTSFRGFPVLRQQRSSSTGSTTSHIHKPARNVLLGYISRTELSYALDHAQNIGGHASAARSATMMCYFMHSSEHERSTGIDLRPWMDQTPITLHVGSSLQLAVSMFQKLGLRYLLLVERGSLRGLLTKKDIWWILNANEVHSSSAQFLPGAGVLRDEQGDDSQENEEVEGLLREER
ncbi:chloride channel [Knufia obscura]|uniref:Chloride channel protein n=2 Tax=Knufia TaxID=430999 RepID=A0AAN8ER15_9EURO|nr:chloride channel [Knufia obscura]KAK5956682.1 chloride channel [Knufia fluminis]